MRSRRRLVQTVVVAAAACLVLGGGGAAAVYPDPPHDFSHPGQTHYGEPLFGRAGGQAAPKLLVLYVRWDDVDYPAAFDATTVARRFFGTGFPGLTFPSVSNYFYATSFGDMFVSAAIEDEGVPSDGVVQVRYPGTKASFLGTAFGTRNKKLLELADDFVDFEDHDVDDDGKLENDELLVNAYEAAPETPMWKGCGVQAGTAAVTLDGVALGGLKVAMTNTATNLLTIAHENAHVALGMKDLYGFPTGGLDIGAASCEPAGAPPDDGLFFAPNAWHKLHWGWITPTVVSQDGFYTVRRADTSGDAFILYDPDRGTDDYFIVENRTRTPGTYDQRISGKGLVIWRVADNAFGVATGYDPIGFMMPDLFRTAWDAAAYPGSPRTMTRPWSDGTPTTVAVRAIGAAGDTMRAYFDVRGPGILVDTYPVDLNGPVKLTAGSSGNVSTPMMNTGEAGCDQFRVEAVGLPAGWTTTPGGRILCAGEESFTLVGIRPDANAAPGPYSISVRGQSVNDPAVASTSPLAVEVVLRQTKFHLDDLVLAGATGAAGTFQVRVADQDDPAEPPVAGVPVTFTLHGPGGTLTAAATTGADGLARVSPELGLPPGSYTLTITTERVGAHGPTTTSVPYTVERRPTTLAYTGSLTGDYSDPANVSATLRDTLTGAPLASRPIAFGLGSQTAGATTGAAGAATATTVVDQPAGDVPASASFAGDATYLPSSDTKTFAITKETLSFAYTGDRVVGGTATPTLAAAASEEADGSPGDLARAQATFGLQPTLTASPFQYTAAVTAAGATTTPATALPGDLWRITVTVPAANPYWEGRTPAAAEDLLATDTKRSGEIEGEGLKTSNGARAELEVEAENDDGKRELDGELTFRTGSTFRAQSFKAFGLSGDRRRAYFAGFGSDTRPFIAYLEDNGSGKKDLFHLWIGAVKQTTDGKLTSGNIEIDDD